MKVSRILILEDSASDQILLKRFIEDNNLCNELVFADRVEEAIEQLEAEDIDIAFLDVNLPGGSGIDVARWINERPAIHTVVVCFTSLSDLRVIEEAKTAGVDFFMEKPMTYENLRVLIQRMDNTSIAIVTKGDVPTSKRVTPMKAGLLAAGVAIGSITSCNTNVCDAEVSYLFNLSLQELAEVKIEDVKSVG